MTKQYEASPDADKNPLRISTGHVLLNVHASAPAGSRREYECVFMQPGRVKRADQDPSNWLIPAHVIMAAEHLFDARPVYLDHPEMFGFGWHQDHQVTALAAVTFSPKWDAVHQKMMGNIRLYDDLPPAIFLRSLLDQILNDKAAGREVPPVGFSATLFHRQHFDEQQAIHITDEFKYVESMDVVYDAGAGGYVAAALAAIGPNRYWHGATSKGAAPLRPDPGGSQMALEQTQPASSAPAPPKTLGDALGDIERVSAQVTNLAAQVATLSTPEPPGEVSPDTAPVPDPATQAIAQLTAQVQSLTDIITTHEEAAAIQGMGEPPILTPGRSGTEQIEAAIEALLTGVRPPDGVRPLSGIREMYLMLSGDYEMTGRFHEDRVYLANVTAATMAQITANVLNKRVMVAFQEYPHWWDRIVAVQDFASLQQVRWITLGGVGELPTVNPGAAYTELTWDDLAQRDDFTKKGGYLGITLEAIDKDDTRKIIAAPHALAQASWLTLSKDISAIFTSNAGVGPNIYYDDTNQRALFHATNLNLGSTALSAAAWQATRIAMRQQTEHNSGERLGALCAPRFCCVPSDMEFTAIQALATAQIPGSTDYNINPEAQGDTREARLAAARERVVVVDLWTDVNNWAAVADPKLYPSIGLGFRYGRTPEIFSVADPRAGLMFSNDVMPVKVRFFYATGPIDWRGLYKHNVA